MATVDREGEAIETGGLASSLASASFVRIVARADGDGVAAAGVLARALSARGIPYQVTTARTAEGRAARAEPVEGDQTTVLAGAAPAAEDAHALPEPAEGDVALSVRAWEVAGDLLADAVGDAETDTDAVAALGLAGAMAAGHPPGAAGTAALLEAVEPARRPGVVTPTDPVDGLAHSTRVHGPFSGSSERVREALADVDVEPADAEGRRELASAVTLSTLGVEAATDAAGTAVERALRPRVAGPVATLGGYADVLDAAAREAPGAAVALALGHDAREPALQAWRDHGRRAHEAVRTASTGRYDGLLAVQADESAPAEAVARLVAGYRSPEPVVAVVTEEHAAAAVRPDVDAPAPGLGRATRAAVGDAAVDGSPRRAVARLPDDAEPTAVIAALREELS